VIILFYYDLVHVFLDYFIYKHFMQWYHMHLNIDTHLR